MRGKAKALRQLNAIGKIGGIPRLATALFEAGKFIEVEAKRSITSGSVGGKNHVASLPGEAPNNDLGGLVSNIETTQPRPFTVLITSSAPYARALEEGTARVEARPYMRPAAKKKTDTATCHFSAAVKREIRRIGS